MVKYAYKTFGQALFVQSMQVGENNAMHDLLGLNCNQKKYSSLWAHLRE